MRFLRRGSTEARPLGSIVSIVSLRALFLVETLRTERDDARADETAAKHIRRCCTALKHVNTPFIHLDKSHTGAPCGKLTNHSWHLVHDNLLKRVRARAHAHVTEVNAYIVHDTCARTERTGRRETERVYERKRSEMIEEKVRSRENPSIEHDVPVR